MKYHTLSFFDESLNKQTPAAKNVTDPVTITIQRCCGSLVFRWTKHRWVTGNSNKLLSLWSVTQHALMPTVSKSLGVTYQVLMRLLIKSERTFGPESFGSPCWFTQSLDESFQLPENRYSPQTQTGLGHWSPHQLRAISEWTRLGAYILYEHTWLVVQLSKALRFMMSSVGGNRWSGGSTALNHCLSSHKSFYSFWNLRGDKCKHKSCKLEYLKELLYFP